MPRPDEHRRTPRDDILDSAEKLFAAQGFAATTIKQIGAEAGVNTALLYYYFESKQGLYREVLRRLIGALVAEGLRRLPPGLPPEQAVRRLIAFQVEFLAAHPRLPPLMARELADHQGAHAQEPITRLASTMFARLCELIVEGQRAGSFRSNLEPRFAAVSIVAQVVYLFIAKPAVGILLGHGPSGPPPDVVAAFAEHAADFALAALADPASAPSAVGSRA